MSEKTEHHFYGSTMFHWETAPTRAEVLKKLARQAGSDTLKRAVAGSGGLMAVTCRVLAPQNAAYKISNYVPVGIETDRFQDFRLVSVKGYVVPVEKDDDE